MTVLPMNPDPICAPISRKILNKELGFTCTAKLHCLRYSSSSALSSWAATDVPILRCSLARKKSIALAV